MSVSNHYLASEKRFSNEISNARAIERVRGREEGNVSKHSWHNKSSLGCTAVILNHVTQPPSPPPSSTIPTRSVMSCLSLHVCTHNVTNGLCIVHAADFHVYWQKPGWLGSVLCNSMRGGTTGSTIYRQDLCTLLRVGRYGGCVGVCGAEEYYFDTVVYKCFCFLLVDFFARGEFCAGMYWNAGSGLLREGLIYDALLVALANHVVPREKAICP